MVDLTGGGCMCSVGGEAARVSAHLHWVGQGERERRYLERESGLN